MTINPDGGLAGDLGLGSMVSQVTHVGNITSQNTTPATRRNTEAWQPPWWGSEGSSHSCKIDIKIIKFMSQCCTV